MPGSVAEGKDMVKDFFITHDLHTVLDIGPGEGTYFFALQDAGVTQLDGVEAWAPYVNQFDLRTKYNNVYISDIYYFDWAKAGYYDMVILGDVVEHLVEAQGREVIGKAAEHGKYVVISLPIYGYPQGWGYDGNWFEAHLEDYSNDRVVNGLLADYNILESMQGGTVGVYIFKGLVE